MGLLIIRLLNVLNNERMDSTFYHIAQILVDNYEIIAYKSISEMAILCNVSKSTMSKFSRKIGFDDYYDLKDYAPFIENRYNNDLNYITNIIDVLENDGVDPYFDAVIRDIKSLKEAIDMNEIDKLAKKIVYAKRVATFGLLFSESAAIDFQYKLAYIGKLAYTFQDEDKQEEFIRNADKETLIVIFSNSGNFLKLQQMQLGNPRKKVFRETKAATVVITANSEISKLPYVNQTILVPHNTSIQTHTFLFQIIMDLIITRYRFFKQKK